MFAKRSILFDYKGKLLLEVQKQCSITYDGLKIKYQQYEATS
jgi:hypothetical protein